MGELEIGISFQENIHKKFAYSSLLLINNCLLIITKHFFISKVNFCLDVQ
jgi:hypothetical protein